MFSVTVIYRLVYGMQIVATGGARAELLPSFWIKVLLLSCRQHLCGAGLLDWQLILSVHLSINIECKTSGKVQEDFLNLAKPLQ